MYSITPEPVIYNKERKVQTNCDGVGGEDPFGPPWAGKGGGCGSLSR